MTKTRLLLIIILTTRHIDLDAQVNNIFGANFGFADLSKNKQYSYPKELNNKLEYNLNYFFSYRLWMVKAEYGLIPSSSFDNIHRFFISTGISTITDKPISFHFLTGCGGYRFIKSYVNAEGDELVHSTKAYLLINSGLLFRPFKKIKMAFGIDLSITGMTLKKTESLGKFTTYYYNYDPLILSVSINYILSKKTENKERPETKE
jgi:hypothetical protein